MNKKKPLAKIPSTDIEIAFSTKNPLILDLKKKKDREILITLACLVENNETLKKLKKQLKI